MSYTGDPGLNVPKAALLFSLYATVCMAAVVVVGVTSFMKAHNTVGMPGPTMGPQMGEGVNTSRGTAYSGSSRSGSSPLTERGALSYSSAEEPRHIPAGGIEITNATRGTGAGASGCYADHKREGAVDIGPSVAEQTRQEIKG